MSKTVKNRLWFFFAWCFPCILGPAIVVSRSFLSGLLSVIISSVIVYGLLTLAKVGGGNHDS